MRSINREVIVFIFACALFVVAISLSTIEAKYWN